MGYHGIIIAGFGGQGVMLMGQVLATAAVIEGKNTTWLPSYGPEMRGGTANCTVVIDEKPVTSPIIDHPTEVIAMNLPSMIKFGPRLKAGGILFVNSSVVDKKLERKDVEIIEIPANDIAEEIGLQKVANMVMLGAFIETTKVVRFESIEKALEEKLKGSKRMFLSVNLDAIRRGSDFVKNKYKVRT
ncbi:2-oxoacid:acceptor oxidoreductase family protein [Thermotoga sp. KOL6]|uniref:2-oxoacid:acceptor oxidoreductase family protein n=1 Tax=Thermotoga sp. KOL6 TaxID=126741 RepID=UPI000C781F77|nr:2-oxoacid:acceptor oxidoreductase family protein [Thermotoga sp. KOL6]PLV60135.1 2-oxoacid:ferredoxin oxidoreductase subunit gamma [Thermotoga sp. KOL6]